MKRIGVFLASEPSSGGTFQYNISILKALSVLPGKEYEVVAAFSKKNWAEFIETYAFTPLDISQVPGGIIYKIDNLFAQAVNKVSNKLHLPFGWQRQFAHRVYRIVRAIVKARCDLWIFPSQDEWGYMGKTKSLVAIHDLMHRYQSRFPEVSEDGSYQWREKHYSRVCEYAAGVLVDSNIGKQQVHESYGMPLERIFVLPFIPPTYIYSEQTDFTKHYDLPRKFIFYPAQFWLHKNHANLIRAVAALKDDIPDISLVLVGGKQNGYKDAECLVDELDLRGNVYFEGYVPNEDLSVFYRKARALVVPTFFGPTNIPPLEAFVLGCPVAVSNIYGMPEQVGDAALLFDPESVGEIADCIRRLWLDDELCKTLVEKGKQRASQWGQAQFGQRLREIIDQLTLN